MDLVASGAELGHHLYLGEVVRPRADPQGIIACLRCGCYAERSNPSGLLLAQACQPGSSKHRSAQLHRLRKGLFPKASARDSLTRVRIIGRI